MHPIFNREGFVTELIGDTDFRTEWEAICGHCPGVDLGTGGGRPGIAIRLICRRAIGAGSDDEASFRHRYRLVGYGRQGHDGGRWGR